MKLRIIEEKRLGTKYVDGGTVEEEVTEFIPQYFDEEDKFPGWQTCHTDNLLVARHYYTLEAAMKVIETFKLKHPKPKVVWEEDY